MDGGDDLNVYAWGGKIFWPWMTWVSSKVWLSLYKTLKLYQIKKILRQEMLRLSAKWSPYRTYACRYLWGWKDNVPVSINKNDTVEADQTNFYYHQTGYIKRTVVCLIQPGGAICMQKLLLVVVPFIWSALFLNPGITETLL